MASGAIKRIPPPPTNRRFVIKSFFVPKSSGGYRLVIDLRFVNNHFPDNKIEFEDLSLLRFVPPTMKVGAKIDLSDAYHHLELHPSLQEYFQFTIDGIFYQCLAIPFGWNLAPYAFTKFTRPVITVLRNPGTVLRPDYTGPLRDLEDHGSHYFL